MGNSENASAERTAKDREPASVAGEEVIVDVVDAGEEEVIVGVEGGVEERTREVINRIELHSYTFSRT